jgi:hypothetical protein
MATGRRNELFRHSYWFALAIAIAIAKVRAV